MSHSDLSLTTLARGSCTAILTGIWRRTCIVFACLGWTDSIALRGLAVVMAEDAPDVASANPNTSEFGVFRC